MAQDQQLEERVLARDIRSDRLLTPALVISARAVDANIATTLATLGGDPARWRPHVKTAKLDWTIRRLLAHGVSAFKCATTLELSTLAAAGAADVLYAMPLSVASAFRLGEIAERHPDMSVAALADSPGILDHWPVNVGLMIDLDVGMHRTGIDVRDEPSIAALASAVGKRGIPLAGLHAYDGHLASLPAEERRFQVHAALDRIAALAEGLRESGIPVPKVTTSGTPTFRDAATHERLSDMDVHHEVSPGTVVYFDLLSAQRLGADHGYQAAAHVLTRVLSSPRQGWVTCDAGHKAVSADAGVPTCVVPGREDLVPGEPTEEHLPMHGDAGSLPAVGDLLTLLPRHICPTVNLYASAFLLSDGQPPSIVPVTARGREAALP